MRSQIGEVMTTYWRRAISGPTVLIAVGLLAFSAVGTVAAILGDMKEAAMAACTAFLGSAFVAFHFKQQTIHFRQRQLPNATTPHVLVAVGFLVLLAMGIPAISVASGNWSWGTAGLNLAISALSFAYFKAASPVLVLSIIPLVVMACIPSVQRWFLEVYQGRHEAIGLPLGAAGVCGIAATLLRLLKLGDEGAGLIDLSDLDNYLRVAGPEMAPTRTASCDSGLGTRRERQVQLWSHWAQGSRWERIKFWRAGSNDGLGPWPSAIFYLMIFTGM